MNKKIIYKISNSINNKIYIGSTKNLKKRIKEHRTANTEIGNAIQELGIEHFSFDVIEEAENYTERENYWISYYDSINTGYNTVQAVWSPVTHEKLLTPKETIRAIEQDIEDGLVYTDIAEKHNCDYHLITDINRGKHFYSDPDRDYPIQIRSNKDKYDDDLVMEIVFDLQHSDLSLTEIAEVYGIANVDRVSRINRGMQHNCPKGIHYPIRPKNFARVKRSLKEIWEIEDLLARSDISTKEIVYSYHIKTKQLEKINNGNFKGCHIRHTKYPLRENL